MTARILLIGGLVLLMIDIARAQVTGLALLGALLIVVAFALRGLFTVEFWMCDDETSHRLDEADIDARRAGR